MFASFYSRFPIACLVLAFALVIQGPACAEAYEDNGKQHSWFSFSRPAKSTPSEQMAHAEKLLRERKAGKAGKAFRSLVVTWPSSAEAPMAQWAYARILDREGKLEDAFDAYQALMENFSGRFPEYNAVLERQFEIAKLVMVKKRGGLLFFGGFSSPERAIPYFEQVIRNGPRTRFAPEALHLIGSAYESTFEYDLAVLAYSSCLHRYPESELAEKASLGRARSLFAISQNFPNDIKSLEEAWAGVMVFIRAYPNSADLTDANQMRDTLLKRKAAADFEIANYYDRIAGKPDAARENYQRVVDFYPETPEAKLAKQRLNEMPDPEEPKPAGEEKKL